MAIGKLCLSGENSKDFGIGIYLCNESVLNLPAADWYVVISGRQGGTGGQIAYGINSMKIYIRSLTASNWTSWSIGNL